jgi:hypothetical protein
MRLRDATRFPRERPRQRPAQCPLWPTLRTEVREVPRNGLMQCSKDYSITSSARSRDDSEMAKLSTLAVVRLMRDQPFPLAGGYGNADRLRERAST